MSELGVLIVVAASPVVVVAARQALRRDAEARTFTLAFPRDVKPDQAVTAVRSIGGLLPPLWRRFLGETPAVTFEVRADSSGITHLIRVEPGHARYVISELSAAMPGLRVGDADPRVDPGWTLVRELRVSGRGALRTEVTAATTTGLLATLQPLRRGEELVVQYVVSPVGTPVLIRLAALVAPREERPVRERSPEPDLALALRVGVAASPGRADGLMARVLGAFHAAGSREARLVRRLWPSLLAARGLRAGAVPRAGGSVLAADELAAVSGLPVGGPTLPGLTLVGARSLPPVAAIPSQGVVLGDATAASTDRPLAIALPELRRGLHLCAPTGAGKSTVLLGIAVQLMQAGHAVVLIDSKGDLALDAANAVPGERVTDALLFDPADARPLGFNLLGHTSDADLIVEHVVGQFRARYGAAGLGPRSEDILRSALLTLARAGGMTLAEVEPLLTNPGFRRRLTAELDEPVLEGFWAWFGALSEAARAEAVAPLANKIRTYTLSRRVRTVIGQTDGLDLGAVLERRGILIVSLARGVVGDDAAALIGAAMVSRLWHVIQARAAVPANERPPATVICDEFQDFAGLPLAFETALAQSRGYGVGWVVAHQSLSQLENRLRQAVLANCRSRLVMQTTAADAGVFAREFAPLLSAADLQGLPAFEGYAAISTGGGVAPAASLRTRPAPASTGSLPAIRARSRALGAHQAEVDAAIRSRTQGRRSSAPVGGRRRS